MLLKRKRRKMLVQKRIRRPSNLNTLLILKLIQTLILVLILRKTLIQALIRILVLILVRRKSPRFRKIASRRPNQRLTASPRPRSLQRHLMSRSPKNLLILIVAIILLLIVMIMIKRRKRNLLSIRRRLLLVLLLVELLVKLSNQNMILLVQNLNPLLNRILITKRQPLSLIKRSLPLVNLLWMLL